MHKLDMSIARLSLLLAEVSGRREALAATRHQYEDQTKRLLNFAVHQDGGVERTLAMLMDVDARLRELERQDHYLSTMRAMAQREIESLRLTKMIEEARDRIAELRAGDAATQGDPAAIEAEIRRLEGVITEASGAAAKSISERVS
jgi:chromosome segregation ATPase